MSGGDPARQATLAACTALMVAALAFAAYAVRAGTIVNFFSETVLVGFKCGVALFLASTQLPKLFGFSGSHGDFWERMGAFPARPRRHQSHLARARRRRAGPAAARQDAPEEPPGGAVRRDRRHRRGAAASPRRSAASRCSARCPRGLPMPALPLVSRADVNTLLPLAHGLLRPRGRGNHGDRPHVRRQAWLSARRDPGVPRDRRAPISPPGSAADFRSAAACRSRSSTKRAGARTPLSGLVAALITLVVVAFFTGLLRFLPQPVLAAIVLVAVTGLVQVDALRHIWRFSRTEFAVAMAALVGVLGSGLLNGVLLGAALSIVAADPSRLASAGDRGRARPRHARTSPISPAIRRTNGSRGVLVVRSEGSLLYFNVDHVRDQLSALLPSATAAPRLLIFFMGNVPYVDLAGAELLASLRASGTGGESSSAWPRHAVRFARRWSASALPPKACSPRPIRRSTTS